MENRIRSMHSSPAIEQNTLTPEEVTDVVDGKRALGPPQDIRKVRNAYEAYEKSADLDPYSVEDLLRAHKMLMEGLTPDAGRFRAENVGVYAGTKLIHAGTPARYVPELIEKSTTGASADASLTETSSESSGEKGRAPNRQDVGLNVGLGEKILRLAAADPTMTIRITAEKLNVTTRTVEREMSKLRKDGKIERVGGKRCGHWEIKT
ncbi:MAG: winged helix-turn-helix transcriptional regulator [Anaerovoracaceae bacterium]